MIDTALILAAGLGTRLAPLSRVRAKAALPVAGAAIIRRQIAWLAAAGVRHVIVNLHHLPATVTAVLGHGDDLGVTVRYSWESTVLGSAGGPRQAFDLVAAERLLVVNGDTLTDVDVHALVAEHARRNALVTMAATPARAGYNALLVTDDDGLDGVARAGAVIPPGRRGLHFMGVQVVERRAFASLAPGVPAETLKWLYPRLIAADPASVQVWPCAASFEDVGTPAEYLRTVQAAAARDGVALDHGPGSHIHPTAVVTGSVLWNDVTVGANATVRDCILADGVRVPGGMHLARVAVVGHDGATVASTGQVRGDLLLVPLDAAAK